MEVDALAFGPHPDDVELIMGGTLLKLRAAGYQTGIVDLTAGELGTRGTPELRAREAAEAAKLLGVAVRRNLGLGDGMLEPAMAAKLKVVEVIRELKPKIVFTNYPENNHPDHTAAGPLVAEAAYLAGLVKLEAGGAPHRPNRVLYYLPPHKIAPSFIVDVTPFHEKKMMAIQSYKSQLYDPDRLARPERSEPETYIGQRAFLSKIEAIDRYYGALIDADFGEAFLVREALRVEDPVGFFQSPFTRIT